MYRTSHRLKKTSTTIQRIINNTVDQYSVRRTLTGWSGPRQNTHIKHCILVTLTELLQRLLEIKYLKNICNRQLRSQSTLLEIHFLPRDAMRKRGLCCRPVSVCLTIRLSRWCIVYKADDIVKLLVSPVAPSFQFFFHPERRYTTPR